MPANGGLSLTRGPNGFALRHGGEAGRGGIPVLYGAQALGKEPGAGTGLLSFGVVLGEMAPRSWTPQLEAKCCSAKNES